MSSVIPSGPGMLPIRCSRRRSRYPGGRWSHREQPSTPKQTGNWCHARLRRRQTLLPRALGLRARCCRRPLHSHPMRSGTRRIRSSLRPLQLVARGRLSLRRSRERRRSSAMFRSGIASPRRSPPLSREGRCGSLSPAGYPVLRRSRTRRSVVSRPRLRRSLPRIRQRQRESESTKWQNLPRECCVCACSPPGNIVGHE